MNLPFAPKPLTLNPFDTLVMKKLTLLSTLAALSLAILSGCSKGPSAEETQRLADLEASVAAKEAQIAAQTKRAAELEEAKRLAEIAAQKAGEAEAARLAELAAQFEREKQEKAKLAALVSNLNAASETSAAEQKRLQDALAKARTDREKDAIEANEKVRAAQAELAAAEASKQAEIRAARAAALAEATAQMQARADQGGYTPATAVVTERKRESISAFLSVEIAERNFRNNTRRHQQRLGAE